mmetsp:Transcript_13697/g.20532  ORF Transcript_13697/g.20532 Transcript_13697/m.20532 type:complete len:138 (+) Transcript_13697:1137-1550(+)
MLMCCVSMGLVPLLGPARSTSTNLEAPRRVLTCTVNTTCPLAESDGFLVLLLEEEAISVPLPLTNRLAVFFLRGAIRSSSSASVVEFTRSRTPCSLSTEGESDLLEDLLVEDVEGVIGPELRLVLLAADGVAYTEVW